MLCPAMLEDIDYQYYVLPALLAVLVLGCFFVLVTSGGGGLQRERCERCEDERTADAHPR